VKLVQDQANAASLSFYRFFLGGIFLFIILFIKKDLLHIKRMLKNNWLLFVLSSSVALGISNILYFIGLYYTQANIAATIYSTYTIWSTIFSIYILNERNNIKLKFVGLILGSLGVLLLMTNLDLLNIISVENLFGNILVLIGSLLWGIYTVLGKKIQLNEPKLSNCALKFSMLSSFLASIPNFIFMLTFTETTSLLIYSFEIWAHIFFLGFICTGLGIFLLFEGLKNVELSKGMSLALLKPIFVAFLAFIILNEIPTIILAISISLIIIAISLINQNRPNHSKAL
jgi:drug/metabolite transporter (DMT)-like permease